MQDVATTREAHVPIASATSARVSRWVQVSGTASASVWSFERSPVPSCGRRDGLVGALKELEQHGVRVRRGADELVRQDEPVGLGQRSRELAWSGTYVCASRGGRSYPLD